MNPFPSSLLWADLTPQIRSLSFPALLSDSARFVQIHYLFGTDPPCSKLLETSFGECGCEPNMGWIIATRNLAKGARSKGKRIYHKVFGPSHKQWKMMKDMLNILVRDQKMETSLARAKELQQYAEEIVFLAKKNSPYHDGLVESMLTSPEARRILYERMLPRYQDRHFHFSRVLNQWRYRERDTTPMAIIECPPATDMGCSAW
ncbi:rplQ [Symbiodinium microadriaticum]|nr:rplQ [Symbiodinium microadriaticum]